MATDSRKASRFFTRTAVLLTAFAWSVVLSHALFAQQAKSAPRPDEPTSETDERLKAGLRRFPDADANKDGILTATEIRAFLKKRKRAEQPSAPPADRANVRYGPYERNVFDLWLPPNASPQKPVPVFVYFHGGGFVGGDKSRFNPTPYLKQGYAVASANYRFVDGKSVLCPVPMQDGARVIQFLRYKADEFGINPRKIAISGGSAGAVITMWIAYKDDMADPNSDDPVARQSTRVTCIVPKSGPTNLDPIWIVRHIGGSKQVHASMPAFYGGEGEDLRNEKVQRMIREASVINHVSADDPPSMIIYRGEIDNVPLPEDAPQGLVIHHPYFGKVLKEKLDQVGVECRFIYGNRYDAEDEFAFLKKHFGQ